MGQEQDYTIDQVAEIIQVHRKTVEDYINAGELEAYQLRRRKRITRDALNRFREKRRIQPQGIKKQEETDTVLVA